VRAREYFCDPDIFCLGLKVRPANIRNNLRHRRLGAYTTHCNNNRDGMWLRPDVDQPKSLSLGPEIPHYRRVVQITSAAADGRIFL